MAKQNNKKSSNPTTNAKPPGRVLTGGHGPQQPITVMDGPAKLRKTLDLSASCSMDQLCEDAAIEIQKLRKVGRDNP